MDDFAVFGFCVERELVTSGGWGAGVCTCFFFFNAFVTGRLVADVFWALDLSSPATDVVGANSSERRKMPFWAVVLEYFMVLCKT